MKIITQDENGVDSLNDINANFGIIAAFMASNTGVNTGDQDLSGLVTKTTKVNGKDLSDDVTLTPTDIGAPAGSGNSTGTNTGDVGYTMQGVVSIATPADSTTYFFGSSGFGGSTSQGYYRFRIPKGGSLKTVVIENYYSGTQPSSETSTIKLRKNGGSDFAFVANDFHNEGNAQSFSYNVSGYTVAAGDYLEFNFTSPAWATNPGTSLTFKTTIYIE